MAGGARAPTASPAVAFLALTLVGVRERLLDAIPDALKHAIAGGIGLLIALVGFEWAGLVRGAPGTLVTLGDLREPATLVAAGGTLLTAALLARRMRGAILVGTVVTAAAAVGLGLVPYRGLVAAPPSLAPTFARLDVLGALRPELAGVVFVFFFLGLFDTIGTLDRRGDRGGAPPGRPAAARARGDGDGCASARSPAPSSAPRR